ncbi:MAG: hydroxyacid dehydrogenase [Ilumatobacter sp.]|nr:hydroxyacid dehydrogenase [Ilumatobacter sp.]
MAGSNEPPLVAIGPEPAPDWLADAVVDGGGQVVPLTESEALVWASVDDVDGLRRALAGAPAVGWVQLPWAGVENFADVIDEERIWTCGKGIYAEPVAELALTLALAGLRRLDVYATATSWSEQLGRNLLDANVTIVGGGGIAEALIALLRPFRCHITVVRSTVQHMEGVDVVVESDRLVDALPGADVVVLALALTPETDGLIGADELALMEPHAWLVNVARGRHVVTDDLVVALAGGVIGGAGLEVTEPEPLPDDHPLWRLENCIITPHTGTTPEMSRPLLAERVRDNVRRFAAGDELIGLVDARSGY